RLGGPVVERVSMAELCDLVRAQRSDSLENHVRIVLARLATQVFDNPSGRCYYGCAPIGFFREGHMYPAAFDYRVPATLDEALSILAQHGESAKVMAGGQSLIPLLKLRFARPELVVDIGRIGGLNTIKHDDGHVVIGALARHADIERSKELAASAPLLPEAAHWIADPLVRNRGTLVGSVCHADPAGDWGS